MAPARRAGTQRYLPMVYLGTAIAVAALALPTALRPPQDLQSQTTAFSPDAPPDEAPPEAILQSLRQARSSTAGGTLREETVEEEILAEQEEEEIAGPPPPPPPKKRAVRGRCFGDPPRQTESVYSALCVPAFTGTDNGGATARGVTADEIRVGTLVGLSSTVPEGPLASEFEETDTEDTRHFKVYQAYFNERFEFYGRYLRLYVVKASDQDEDQARGAIRDAMTRSGGIFGWIGNSGTLPTAAMVAEIVRQKMIVFAIGQNPVDFYKDSHPYAYSFTQDSWQTRYLGGELVCKHYANRPLGENNLNAKQDLSFNYNEPRKFGLIIYQDEVRAGARQMYEDVLAKCGQKFVAVAEYNLTDNQQAIAGTAAKMKQAGATTVIMGLDPLTPGVVSNEAERIAYYPEWIGTTGTDSAGAGRLFQDNQAEHLIAIRSGEIPRADEDKDWFRAYKEIAPDGDPDLPGVYRYLQQLSGGIQLAGTNLTPENFWKGLRQNPCRIPEPVWSIGGCYKDPDPTSDLHFLGDYTYADYVNLGWFDNKADDPESASTGAFCFMDNGQRYRYKELPTAPLPFRDPNRCIVTPSRGVQG